nr:hypothetical protein Itr_chr14CG01720 [Ipomoea trifida]
MPVRIEGKGKTIEIVKTKGIANKITEEFTMYLPKLNRRTGFFLSLLILARQPNLSQQKAVLCTPCRASSDDQFLDGIMRPLRLLPVGEPFDGGRGPVEAVIDEHMVAELLSDDGEIGSFLCSV